MGFIFSKKILLFLTGIMCFSLLGMFIYKTSRNYKPKIELRKEIGFYQGIPKEKLGLSNSETIRINNCFRLNERVLKKAVITVVPDGAPLEKEIIAAEDPLQFKLTITGTEGIDFDMKHVFCRREDFVSKLVDSLQKGVEVLSHYQKKYDFRKPGTKIFDM